MAYLRQALVPSCLDANVVRPLNAPKKICAMRTAPVSLSLTSTM
jgi:hypothetical protein